MSLGFKKAVKSESKLRLLLAGPSGSGKTYTALSIASALANGASVAVIDTERGSASKYSDLFAFDVLELDSFHPDRYIEAIQMAQDAGYGVLVIDSLTHEWNGRDGILEQIDIICRRDRCTSIQAWAKATPMHNRLLDAMMRSNLHVIGTVRSKMGVNVDKDERGKTTVQKVGMEAEQRNGIEYEFDVAGDLDRDNTLVISKSRCPDLAGQIIRKPGAALAQTLAGWLQGAPAPVLRPVQPLQPLQPVEVAEQAQPVEPAPVDRYTRAVRDKRVVELLIERGRLSDADRRAELESVFDAIEQGGGTVNLVTIRAELSARLSDLANVDMGAPGN